MSIKTSVNEALVGAAIALASISFGSGCREQRPEGTDEPSGAAVSATSTEPGFDVNKVRELASQLPARDLIRVHSVSDLEERVEASQRAEAQHALRDAASYLSADQIVGAKSFEDLFRVASDNGWKGEAPAFLLEPSSAKSSK